MTRITRRSRNSRHWRLILLFQEFFAGGGVGTPEFDAPGVIHRALPDDLSEQEVAKQVDLALLQRGRRVGHACRVRFQLRLLLAGAAAIPVRTLVKRRQSRVEPRALDRRAQAAAAELGTTQVASLGYV